MPTSLKATASIVLVTLTLAMVIAACGGARPADSVAAPGLTPTTTPEARPAEAGACALRRPAGCGGGAPSFARDVEPIVARRCRTCHTYGGSPGPSLDFSSVATVVAHKDKVVSEVSSCEMPPKTAPQLEAAEADVLLRWASCGAPQN
jgi:uncharacterized membrane protein